MSDPAIFDAPTHPALTRREADQVWDRLAARYAAEASGDVTLTVHDVLVTSVLLQRNLPALRRNPKVTSLRLVDPDDRRGARAAARRVLTP